MSPANRLAATAERVEEFNELRGRHSLSVVGNHPAVDADTFYGLPLNAEFNARCLGLESVCKKLAHPLELAAPAVRSLNEVLRSRRLHGQDTARGGVR
jgi:hypothetical protein